MSKNLKLLTLLQKAANEITEGLVPFRRYSALGEDMLYGTFERRYEAFYMLNLRNGKKVNEKDYIKFQIKELERIEDEVLLLEKGGIECPAILSIIYNAKRDAGIKVKSKRSFIKKRGTPVILTYKWIDKASNISKLFDLLKTNKLIDKNTLFHDFTHVFSHKNLEQIKSPIIWSSANASELLYFVVQLHAKAVVGINSTNRINYTLLKGCFIKPDKNKFIENFRQLKTDIKLRLDGDKINLIDSIIDKIKS